MPRCPQCGAVNAMKNSCCEKCKIISPRPSRRLALGKIVRAVVSLGGYSALKDAAVWARRRIKVQPAPLRVAVSDSVQVNEKVTASMSSFHATVQHVYIPGPNNVSSGQQIA